MYSGGVNGRARWLGAAICVLVVAAADARAEKKKKKDDDSEPFNLKSLFTGRREAETVKELTPDGLNLTPGVAPMGQSRVIRVRIYADRDYRSQIFRWQVKARAHIQRVSGVVATVFNVRFEVESLRDWDRTHISLPLGDAMIDELRALDDGSEVDLVVGLVTPMRGVATSADAIGRAALLSRYFVLRGMDDDQELQAVQNELKLISAEEVHRLYMQRKAHKEIVVFLHEWGHTLGLLHNEDRKVIMNPAYDPKQADFSDYEKRILALVLERRLAARDQPFPESADLIPLLTAMPATEGSDADRAYLLDLARSRAKVGAARPPPDLKDTIELPSADIDAFNRAVGKLNAGHADDAWKELAPVDARTRARKVGGKTWLRIAELEAALGALTAADEAAGRAGALPAAQKISADIESMRHRIALPLEATKLGVPPDREPAYVAAYWQTAKLLDGSDGAAARTRLDELAQAFPDAPGVEVLTCDLELQAKHLAVASKHCEAALAKFKGATRAHVLLAAIAFSMRKGPVGEQHLRQAILLDPADPTGWRALARFYRQTRASRQLAALENQHKELLSSPLPE